MGTHNTTKRFKAAMILSMFGVHGLPVLGIAQNAPPTIQDSSQGMSVPPVPVPTQAPPWVPSANSLPALPPPSQQRFAPPQVQTAPQVQIFPQAQAWPQVQVTPQVQAQTSRGQWVYTSQYGWVWIPYGNEYVYTPTPGSGYNDPYACVYDPSYGWTWLPAPWVRGQGPQPYFGNYYRASSYSWYRPHYVHRQYYYGNQPQYYGSYGYSTAPRVRVYSPSYPTRVYVYPSNPSYGGNRGGYSSSGGGAYGSGNSFQRGGYTHRGGGFYGGRHR